MLDYDAAWDAWAAAGHDGHGGYKYDPGEGMISCACGEVIPGPASEMPDCQARVGWYDRPPAESLAGAWGCPDQATVTLRGACAHEHVREKSFCARHGQVNPADAVWLCASCAETGHDCPMTVTVVESPPPPPGPRAASPGQPPPPRARTQAGAGDQDPAGTVPDEKAPSGPAVPAGTTTEERAAQRDTWRRAQAAHGRGRRGHPYRARTRGPDARAGMHRIPPPDPGPGAA
jgi:hypothetical protein